MYLSLQNVHFPEGLLPAPLADSTSSFTDESGWDDPNGEIDSYFDSSQSQTSWKCLKCRAPTSAPRNFCFTCYQVLLYLSHSHEILVSKIFFY